MERNPIDTNILTDSTEGPYDLDRGCRVTVSVWCVDDRWKTDLEGIDMTINNACPTTA